MKEISLRHAALAAALTDLERGVHETRENWSPRIDEYFRNLEPPIVIAPGAAGVPWCAAGLQYWLDQGARTIGVANPFDAVPLEAYVQSYVDLAKRTPGLRILAGGEKPRSGDVFCIYFRTLERYAHTGLVLYPEEGGFRTVEGNSNDNGSREGTSVVSKRRSYGPSVLFIRYGE